MIWEKNLSAFVNTKNGDVVFDIAEEFLIQKELLRQKATQVNNEQGKKEKSRQVLLTNSGIQFRSISKKNGNAWIRDAQLNWHEKFSQRLFKTRLTQMKNANRAHLLWKIYRQDPNDEQRTASVWAWLTLSNRGPFGWIKSSKNHQFGDSLLINFS